VSFGGGATMMALAAQTTPRIKAAWLDSPVCERDEVLARNTMMVMPVLSIGAAKSVAELSTSFADSWTPHDLYSPTQIGSMASLDSSQSVYMVSTTGDETVPWYTSKPCRDAAIASGAATSFHLYDDRVDFDSDREDSPIYTEETTSFYNTHVQAMLYFSSDYEVRQSRFFCDALGANSLGANLSSPMLCPTGALLPAVDGPGPFLSDNEGAFVIFIFVLIAVGINIWMLFNKCCLHKVFNPFRIDYQIAKPNQVTPSTEAIVDAAKDAPPVATYERRRSSTTLTGERRLSFDDDANAAPSFNRHNKTVLTEELSKGQGLKRAKTVGLTLTTLNEETDASMMGCRPDAKTQEKIDAILSGQRVPGVSFAHLLPTEKERFIQMTKDFPCYFATTLLHLILPTLAGCIPVVILGVRYRALRNQLPDFVGSAGDFNGAQIHKMSDGNFAASVIDRPFIIAGYYTLIACIFLTMWNWKKLGKVMVMTLSPFYIMHVILSISHRFETRENSSCDGAWSSLMFAAQGMLVLFSMITTACVIQEFTKQAGFALMFALWAVIVLIIVITYQIVLFTVAINGTNMTRLVIGAFVNPILWEFILYFSRVIVRTSPHCHESTLPNVCAGVMAYKKMLGRFVIGCISSGGLQVFASVILGIAEIVFSLTLVQRDKFFYKCCIGTFMPQEGDLLAAMKKRYLLRSRNQHTETVLELAFTVIAQFVILVVWDISIDGKNAPDPWFLIQMVIAQFFIEMVVDYICCGWLCVRSMQPIMAISHLNFKGYTLFMCCLMYSGTVMMADNIVPAFIGNAGTQNSAWTLYIDTVFDHVNLTYAREC